MSDGHRRRWRLIGIDLALLALGYALYTFVRNGVHGETASAVRRGTDFWHFEQWLGLDPEHALNKAVAAHPIIANVSDYYYATVHFIAFFAVLGWLYWRHPEAARRSISAWFAMNLLGLVGFWLLPTAPPRLLPGAGFVDTVVHFHTWGSLADSTVASAANQFAAFPSLHVGWALWAAIIVHQLARRRWVGRLAFAYPVLTALVVLGTANHYLIDVLAGVAVCLLGFLASRWAFLLADIARRRAWLPVPAFGSAGRVPGWFSVLHRHRRSVIAVAVVVALAVTASVLTVGRLSREHAAASRRAANAAASVFLNAWSSGQYQTMANLTGQPAQTLTAFYQASVRGAHESAARYDLGVVTTGRGARASFTAHVTVAGYGVWSYSGVLPLVDHSGHWSVEWSPSTLYPGLPAGGRLALQTTPVVAGHVLDDTGRRIRGADADLTASLLSTNPAGSTVREPSGTGLETLDRQLSGVLAGRPNGAIAVVDAAGKTLRVLHRFAPDSGRSVRTTLDLGMQHLAEQIVDGSPLPTSLVAVDTRTGAVKVAANNAAAGNEAALAGRFPPGSTFKIVTATAALENGYRLDTPVDCPATRTAGGFTFHNAGHEVLGEITFEKAFAVSCNTAFVGIAESLPAGALARAAAFYGCTTRTPAATQERPLPVPSFACNYPPSDGAAYAASAFGQAAVEVSPLGMTMISAAASSGTWHPLTVLPAGLTGAPPSLPVRHLPPAVMAQLRVAMRAVVTSGTATSIADTPIAGKTGTAEYGTGDPLPTDAWFTGYLGNYDVTVLVQDGGYGGDAAAPLAARFLTGVQSSATTVGPA